MGTRAVALAGEPAGRLLPKAAGAAQCCFQVGGTGMRVLIAGLSTRAIAESAAHSGHQVVTLDYFGDRDQRAQVENYALLRDFGLPFGAEALLQANRRLAFEAVVYISNLENHPAVVEELARGRLLLGNEAATLRQVRDWRTLRTFCREAGIDCPRTLLAGEEREAEPAGHWLCKPVASGGGHGIRPWNGQPLDQDHLLQATVEGRAASAAFVADGQRCVLLALTEQLIGREALGARGTTWCGNILPLVTDSGGEAALLDKVETIATQLVRRFGLKGVNGIDLVVVEGPSMQPTPFLVEVNPRYSASMELAERAYGLGIYEIHVESFRGRLPAFTLPATLPGLFLGKGIVYARRAVTVPQTKDWVRRDRRDIPFPGDQIEAGHPVCTVFAQGETRAECWDHLVAAAEAVRQEIGDRDEKAEQP
jgi:predicted ATP-grasp superfamily ATP-dependent carboligase